MTLKTSFTTIRYFTNVDPYHYTIDNRPLTDLKTCLDFLADTMDAGFTTGFLKIASSPVTYVLAKSSVAVSCPADATEDTLATITVPAGALGANGALRIKTYWTFTNSGNNKTFRVRYSGGAGTQVWSLVQTTDVSLFGETIISNRNATGSQFALTYAFNSASGGVNTKTTASVDTTASTTVVITGQKATSGETLTLEAYTVELMPT